jgi:hypothetical protein
MPAAGIRSALCATSTVKPKVANEASIRLPGTSRASQPRRGPPSCRVLPLLQFWSLRWNEAWILMMAPTHCVYSMVGIERMLT